MQKLNIMLFRDGRPGHEKQSLGIIGALRRYTDVAVAEFQVKQEPWWSLLGAHARYLLKIERSPLKENDIDLIIGTGSRTHIPMLAAARACGAKSVTCMTPALHLIRYFDLCCVPVHDSISDSDTVFKTVGPPNIARSSNQHEADRALILVGGVDEKSHVWDNGQLIKALSTILEEARRWTVSTSPRTPEHTENLIGELVANRNNVEFYPFSATPTGWVEEQYRINETVWITGDSISMVYEALTAGCWVGVIPVQWKKADNKFKRSLAYLAEKKLIVEFDSYQPGKTFIAKREPLNEADRCAQEILSRWWPTRLP